MDRASDFQSVGCLFMANTLGANLTVQTLFALLSSCRETG